MKMDVTLEIEEVKQELLDLILDHLKKNKIQTEQAQQQARDFLNALPIKDHADLLAKLKNLGHKYVESESVYLHELEKAEAEKRDEALSQIRDQIQKGNINSAISIAKALTSNPQS